jgi:hypothetical protein
MKKLLLLVAFFLNLSFISAQNFMTYREINDFNVNDEFQTRLQVNSGPPNVVRIKILGKYFSADTNTVFYVRQYNNYQVTCCWYNVFQSGIDTISYNYSDSLFSISGSFIDSCNLYSDTIYYSSVYCGEKVYEHISYSNCLEYWKDIYGKGLGQVYHEYAYPDAFYDLVMNMFYYKKDTLTCGTPDLTTEVSAPEAHTTFSISPNPAHDKLNVECNLPNAELKIYDMTGRMVQEEKLHSPLSTVNCQLSSGVYFVTVAVGDKMSNQKLIVE